LSDSERIGRHQGEGKKAFLSKKKKRCSERKEVREQKKTKKKHAGTGNTGLQRGEKKREGQEGGSKKKEQNGETGLCNISETGWGDKGGGT